jgi:hypothetical protein
LKWLSPFLVIAANRNSSFHPSLENEIWFDLVITQLYC